MGPDWPGPGGLVLLPSAACCLPLPPLCHYLAPEITQSKCGRLKPTLREGRRRASAHRQGPPVGLAARFSYCCARGTGPAGQTQPGQIRPASNPPRTRAKHRRAPFSCTTMEAFLGVGRKSAVSSLCTSHGPSGTPHGADVAPARGPGPRRGARLLMCMCVQPADLNLL